MIEYEYWSEETEVMEYTRELQNILPDPNKFSVLFDCFLNKKMAALADIMVSMLREGIRYKNIAAEKDAEIDKLKMQLKEQENRVRELQTKLNGSGQLGGEDIQKLMEMKTLYQQGYSLRRLGKIFHCDKSTIKRKLMKMGISFE